MLEELFAKIRQEQENTGKQEIDWVIVGLGNPGSQYAQSWHNLGFMCLDILQQRHNFRCDKIRFKALMADTRLYGGRQIWLRPQTYMNNSGESLREALAFYKLPASKALIILDDLDLELGYLRIRKKGSAGTHNGLRSIIYQTESQDMARLRIGFGPKPPHIDIIDFVLSKIPPEQKELTQQSLNYTADAVEMILQDGLDLAMSKMNGAVHRDS